MTTENRANISRERLRQLRKNANDLCYRAGCDEPKAKRGLCEKHGAADLAWRKKRYAERKAAR